MPTFATNTFADQTTPAANEAWTVNAGALAIVAGDYINAAAPNPYTGVNTVNEGKLLIDGRLCWEIGTANTTNAAVGLAVTGATSGATAVVTQVLASPTRLKFRYTNNLVFQSGETISGGSFAAAANTAPTRSTILYGINGASNGLSVARLGNLEIHGVWRQLGTATGAANQTLTHWMSGVTAGIWVQKGNIATLTNASNQIALAHEFAIGQVLEFATSGSLSGTNFSTGTKYYIVASDWSGLTGQFGSYVSLATTKTGSAIAATGTGTGTIALLASGAIVTFTNGAATIAATSGHNRSNGDSLTLSSSGSLPGGFDDINTYWVINSDTTAGTFQLCTDYNPFTGAGTPITATSAGAGTHQLVPDDNYLIWQNIVDRTLTGATAAVGIDLNHGRFFKQTSGSTAIVFGDEGAAAAVTFSTTNASTTLTSSAVHGRIVGDVIRISNPPTPFTTNTDYYVLTVPSSTTLTVSTNINTAAIAATQTQTNTATLLPQIGGKIPAYGAKVRVPNVAIVSTNSANAPAPIISSFVTVANSVGTFVFDKCITAGIQFSSNNLSGFTARFTTFHNLLNLVYVLNPTVFQDVAISSSSGDSTSGINLASQVFDIQNIFSVTTNFTAFTLTNCLQGSVKGGSTIMFGRANAQLQCLNFTNIGNLPLQKLRYLGGGISLSGGTNENLFNLAHSDSVVRGSYTTFPQDSFLGSVSANTVIDQLQVLAPPKNSLFKTPANTTVIRRVGTSSNPVDLVGQTGSLITFSSVDSFSLIDCFWKNTSTSHFGFQTNVVLSNIKIFNSGDYTRSFALGARLKNIRLKALRGSSFSSTVEGSGLHFYDLFTSATAGLFGLIFYPKNTDDYFSNLSYAIDSDTTPTSTYFINGALQLRTSGNQITYTTPFIQGHTTLGALTVTSNNNSNYTFSYDLDTGSGFSGSFTTITSGSSLGVTIATPATGFRLKIRLLAIVTAAANSITALTVATTSTANAQAAISYPYQASTFVINGLVAGSTVALFDNNGTLVQSGTATTGSFTFNPIEYFSSVNYTIRYRRYGYKEGSILVTLANGTTTNTIAQVIDPFVSASLATVAAYSNISVGYSPRALTVGALTQQQIYDFCAYTDALLANIGQAVLLTTADGLSLTLTASLILTSAPTGTGTLSLSTGFNATISTAGSYTGLAVGLSSTGKAILPPGTSTLSNWLFGNGAKIDNSSASAATAIVGGTQIANVTAASPTTGGGTVTITLSSINIFSGLLTGSTVGFFNSASTQNTSTLVESGTASGTTYTFAAINFTGTVTYSYRVRLYGYNEVTGTITLGSGTVTTPIAQTVNPFITVANAVTVAAYTGIATSNASQTVTQTVTHSRAELFDRVQYNNALLTNIVYALPLTTANGTDLTLTYNYVRTSCALTGTGSLSLPTKTATITGDNSTGQLPVTDSTGLRFRVYGLPTSGSPVMRSQRVSTGVITNPTVNANGEAYFTILLSEDYQMRADAIGYGASGFITINSSSAASLQIPLSRVVETDGTAAYGKGITAIKNAIAFNPSTFVIGITNASSTTLVLDNHSVLDAIEELTVANPIFLEFTALPYYRDGEIVFPLDSVSGLPNPVKIQAATGNVGKFKLAFQIEDQGQPSPERLFDFANGGFFYYTQVNLAQGGSSGSGLTAQQVRDAAALALSSSVIAASGSIDDYTAKVSALIENVSGNRFTAKALEASPAGSGGGTTAQQIADALKLAPATGTPATGSVYNLLNNVPSAVWSNSTRLLTAGTNIALAKGTGLTGLNDLAATDVWAAGTRSLTDKTGFSLSQAFPTNFSSFAITAGGSVTAGSVSDKTGYSLSQAFPTNFSSLAIAGSGAVTAGTVSDKTGYALSSTQAFNLVGDITGNLSGSAGSVTGAVGSVTSPVTAGTVSDKTGYALSSAGVQAIWDALTSALTTVGSVGKRIADFLNASVAAIPTTPLLTGDSRLNNLDAAISTRSTYAGTDTAGTTTLLSRLTSTRATNLDNLDATISSRLAAAGYITPPTASAITTAVWAAATRELTSGNGIVLAKGTGITGLNDITAQSVLSLATSGQTTAGTIGKLLVDNVNAPIGSVPTNSLLVSDGRLNNLDATISSRLATSGYTAPDNTTIGTIGTRTARVDGLIVNPGGGDRFTTTALLNAPVTSVDLSSINTALGDIKGASFSTSTDSLHALRTRGDVAWITGFGSGDRATLGNIPTTVYTGALTTLQTSVNAIPTMVYTSSLSTILSAVQAIPTTPLLTGDSRLNYLNASIAAIPTAAAPTAVAIRQEMDANSAIATNAKLAKQGVTNRYKIDEDANTGTLYADDGVTPIVVQALKDKDGQPASTQTYERVPQ